MLEPVPGMLRTGSWKDDYVCYYEVETGGIISLKELYMYMWNQMRHLQLTHWASNDNKIEDFYLHRVRPDGVQENLIWWRMRKVINKYLCYTCKMDWQNFGAKPTEIMYNDKKVKSDKLGLVIRVWWWVQWDPENRWEKSWLGKLWGGKFTKWYHQYFLNDEMEMHRDKCHELAKEQERIIKSYFEMATDRPQPRTWFPEVGYKWKKPKVEGSTFEHQERQPDHKI